SWPRPSTSWKGASEPCAARMSCARPVRLPIGLMMRSPTSGLSPMFRRLTILLLLAVLSAGAPARAQTAAPFDANLQRLAEIMGSLHYLRGICGANEGQKWRNEVQALIEAETATGERRARMIAAFNRGYR